MAESPAVPYQTPDGHTVIDQVEPEYRVDVAHHEQRGPKSFRVWESWGWFLFREDAAKCMAQIHGRHEAVRVVEVRNA